MNSISVRLATEADSKEIFEWRNDELTRQMSHTSEVVEWEGHRRWFENSLSSQCRLLLICEGIFSEKIAIVRFDLEADDALVSINLSPNQRGKGFAKDCLSSSIDYISKKYKDLQYLMAEIKEINLASQKTFLGVGFELYEVKDGMGYYRKVLG